MDSNMWINENVVKLGPVSTNAQRSHNAKLYIIR